MRVPAPVIAMLTSASIAACAGPTATAPTETEAPGATTAACNAADVERERKAVLAAEASWAKAVHDKDVDAVLTYFEPDGQSLPPDEPIIAGDQARRAYLTKIFTEPDFDSGWETTRVVIAGACDMALSVGTTTHAADKDPSGREQREEGKYVTVWRKVRGEWKVAADIWNTTRVGPAPTSGSK